MRWTLLPVCLLFTGLCAFADPINPMGSLRATLITAKDDSSRSKAWMAIAGEWLESSPDSAYACCLHAQAIAPRTHRPDDPGEVEGWLGYIEEQRGHIPEAIAHYFVDRA